MATNKKPGRPRSKDTRNLVVGIRVNEQEHAEWLAAADKASRSMADLGRLIIFDEFHKLKGDGT